MHTFVLTCDCAILPASGKQCVRLPPFGALEKLKFVKFCQSLELGLVRGYETPFLYCFNILVPASSDTAHIF